MWTYIHVTLLWGLSVNLPHDHKRLLTVVFLVTYCEREALEIDALTDAMNSFKALKGTES